MKPSDSIATRPSVVINADDLGISEDRDRAILAAFERGLITSATVMPNMPDFAAACTAVAQRGLQDRVGVHLNLTEGTPLTDEIRRQPRLCRPDGRFALSRSDGPLWRLTTSEKGAIEAELAAQIGAVLASGIVPSHLDSHHHAHTLWPIGSIVMCLARRHGIGAIRLSRNCGASPGLAKRLYKRAFNSRLERAGLAPTRHFGSADDAATLVELAGPLEVMVHPVFADDGRIVDTTTAVPGSLERIAERWRTVGDLVGYRELP